MLSVSVLELSFYLSVCNQITLSRTSEECILSQASAQDRFHCSSSVNIG